MTASHSASSDLAVEGDAGVGAPLAEDGMGTVLDGGIETDGGGAGRGTGGAESRTARRAVEEPVMRGSASVLDDVCDRPDGGGVDAGGIT